MLVVDTYLAPSKIHGIGLYAARDIKRGELIWKLHEKTSKVFWKRQFLNFCKTLSYPALKEFIGYSYIRGGYVFNIHCNARFINHSLSPNVGLQSDYYEVALRDIKKDEELTENYLHSYDFNDFFFLDQSEVFTKEELIREIKSHILSSDIEGFTFSGSA